MNEGLQESAPKMIPVPEIYKLSEQKADIQEILKQIYIDFYRNGTGDMEKVYLGIQALLMRKEEGVNGFRQLLVSSDELGSTMQKLVDARAMGHEAEILLGINRFKNLIAESVSQEEFFRQIYADAKAKGYTDLSFEQCMENYTDWQNNPSAKHYTGTLESEILETSITFGNYEPQYLELVGQMEILRMRAKIRPSFLLLGSLGQYSAREFRAYSRKINPTANPVVIDLGDTPVSLMAADPTRNGDPIVQADARNMSFKDESMDHVYTNKLIHHLGRSEGKIDISEDVINLLKESFRVLKPGGRFVMVESPSASSNVPSEAMLGALIQIAQQVGFKMSATSLSPVSNLHRKEVGTATIDENGFAQYGNALLGIRNTTTFSVMFTKPK